MLPPHQAQASLCARPRPTFLFWAPRTRASRYFAHFLRLKSYFGHFATSTFNGSEERRSPPPLPALLELSALPFLPPHPSPPQPNMLRRGPLPSVSAPSQQQKSMERGVQDGRHRSLGLHMGRCKGIWLRVSAAMRMWVERSCEDLDRGATRGISRQAPAVPICSSELHSRLLPLRRVFGSRPLLGGKAPPSRNLVGGSSLTPSHSTSPTFVGVAAFVASGPVCFLALAPVLGTYRSLPSAPPCLLPLPAPPAPAPHRQAVLALRRTQRSPLSSDPGAGPKDQPPSH